MNNLNLILAVLVATSLSSPVQAKDYTMDAQTLQVICNVGTEGMCTDYIKGAADARTDTFCQPGYTTDAVLVAVVRRYFDSIDMATDATLFRNAADGVAAALQKEWPCKE